MTTASAPMTARSSLLDELAWRELLYQTTDGAAQHLAAGTVTGYCGFDPTAPSLHVGNLVPVMGLVHLQRAGHRPVAVVGGGTGLIGDPSGKATERQLATPEVVDQNARAIRAQLERFLEFSGPRAAVMRNNADWLLGLGAVEFMRDVGKHFTVNYMLQKESVKGRMEAGISYTEFSYMLLQAYDYLELYRRHGVTLQIGGSDQWGNMTAGVELVRRTLGAEAHAVTLPLLTTAAGTKFGKSEAGAVWLDPALTSPYQFYQFWINTDDRDVGRFLRYFTLLDREAIEALDGEVAEHPERRTAQRELARDVTTRVHSADAVGRVERALHALFDKDADPSHLEPEVFELLRAEIPSKLRPWEWTPPPEASQPGEVRAPVLEMLVETGLAKSKGDARKLLQQGAVSVNGKRLGASDLYLSPSDAVYGKYFLIRKGPRERALVVMQGPLAA